MVENPVICLGSTVWDTIFQVEAIPASGIKVLPGRAVQMASGMATSAAVTIARLGGSVELWARLGDDDTGRRFVQDIRSEGVGTQHMRLVPGVQTPFSTVIVDKAGERLVVPYFDPALPADASWLPLKRVAQAGAVLADMRWVDGALALLQAAKSSGVPAILDADTAPIDDLRKLVPVASHVLFSEPALKSYTRQDAADQAVLAVARETDATVVGVTMGEHGALIWTRDTLEVRHFPAPKITPKDTLNAGDVWHGTFAWGLTKSWPMSRIVMMANIAAAMKCEVFGGRLGAPTYAQLQERVKALGADYKDPH